MLSFYDLESVEVQVAGRSAGWRLAGSARRRIEVPVVVLLWLRSFLHGLATLCSFTNRCASFGWA